MPKPVGHDTNVEPAVGPLCGVGQRDAHVGFARTLGFHDPSRARRELVTIDPEIGEEHRQKLPRTGERSDSQPPTVRRTESHDGETVIGCLVCVTVSAFLGIPYAEAPVGDAAVAGPRAGAAVDRQRRRGDDAAGAAAADGGAARRARPCPGIDVDRTDEDCLYLNVWAPHGCVGRAGDGVAARWRVRHRRRGHPAVRRRPARGARCGRRHRDLPARCVGVRRGARLPAEPGPARPGRGAALGARQHRRRSAATPATSRCSASRPAAGRSST